jgi:hypothetical protein
VPSWPGTDLYGLYRFMAWKLRRGCLLGPKVPDSDWDMETVIFRYNDATNAVVVLVLSYEQKFSSLTPE